MDHEPDTNPVPGRSFRYARPGDVVTRMLAGTIPMEMRVSDVDDELIHCGAWTFDRATGAEVDAELGWGPPAFGITGSYLVAVSRGRP